MCRWSCGDVCVCVCAPWSCGDVCVCVHLGAVEMCVCTVEQMAGSPYGSAGLLFADCAALKQVAGEESLVPVVAFLNGPCFY